jgi:hypothetical protein
MRRMPIRLPTSALAFALLSFLFAAIGAQAATVEYASATLDDKQQLQLEDSNGIRSAAPLAPVALETIGNQVGFDQPLIAPDRRTLGWLAEYDNCCTSYSIPLQLILYRDGRIVRKLRGNGLPIWQWRFVHGAKQVVFVQRPTHGSFPDHYELRDVASGRLQAEYDQYDDQDRQKMPRWAADLHGFE